VYECGLISATNLTTLKFQSTFNGQKGIQFLATYCIWQLLGLSCTLCH